MLIPELSLVSSGHEGKYLNTGRSARVILVQSWNARHEVLEACNGIAMTHQFTFETLTSTPITSRLLVLSHLLRFWRRPRVRGGYELLFSGNSHPRWAGLRRSRGRTHTGRGMTSSMLIGILDRAWQVELHSLDHESRKAACRSGAPPSRMRFPIPPLSETAVAWNGLHTDVYTSIMA